MPALAIGMLMVLMFFAIMSAVYAAAPFIAVGAVLVVLWFLLSKESRKPPDPS